MGRNTFIRGAISGFCMSLGILAATGAVAESKGGYNINTGAAERIATADRLRSLTQQIPAATCFYHNGVNPKVARARLSHAMFLFSGGLTALRHGDKRMGIDEPETSIRMQRRIDAMTGRWQEIEPYVRVVLDNHTDAPAVSAVYEMAGDASEYSKEMAAEFQGRYSNPVEFTLAGALQMEIAGRQAMLTQKIAYELCRVWAEPDNEDLKASLRESIDTFSRSIVALRDGMPEIGLAPAPNVRIENFLNKIEAQWADDVETIEAFITSTATAEDKVDDATALYEILIKKMDTMNNVVEMYGQAARTGL